MSRRSLWRRRDPFDHRDWLFELKLDGFRALAHVEHGQGRLVSRNGNTFKRFAALASEIAVALGRVNNAILDAKDQESRIQPGGGAARPVRWVQGREAVRAPGLNPE